MRWERVYGRVLEKGVWLKALEEEGDVRVFHLLDSGEPMTLQQILDEADRRNAMRKKDSCPFPHTSGEMVRSLELAKQYGFVISHD